MSGAETTMTAPRARTERVGPAPTEAPPRDERRSRPVRRRSKLALRIVRRVHLYAGIALLPWVLLYGATGVLINHSSWFTDSRSVAIDAERIGELGLAFTPDARGAAERALVALAKGRDGVDGPRLVGGSERWTGAWSLRARTDDATLTLSLDPEGRGGVFRSSPRDDREPLPEWASVDRIADLELVDREHLDGVEDSAAALAASLGAHEAGFDLRRRPGLRFEVVDDGMSYTCDVRADGRIEVAPSGGRSTLRERLVRLHFAHGDPGYAGVRRAWALAVDATGFSMILWAVTGLVMWWTIRPTRRAGLLALVAGLLAMGALAASLWSLLGLT